MILLSLIKVIGLSLGLKIHKNITYIVAAVVIQDGKVLLTQEAFHPCRGKWYLPAGKMEPNETIIVCSAKYRIHSIMQ